MGEPSEKSFVARSVIHSLLVAALTAGATTYTTAKVLESEIRFIHETLDRHNKELIDDRVKIDSVAMKQSAAIAERLSNEKSLQLQIDQLVRRR